MRTLPFAESVGGSAVQKALIEANAKLGELNGMIRMLKNPDLIFNAIAIGEAKDSSAIENIVTTYDEIYKGMVAKPGMNGAVKEVLSYREAVHFGYREMMKKGFLATNDFVAIHHMVEPDKGDIRKIPGTIIKNDKTGEVVYTPPQSESEIRDLLKNLDDYINDDALEDIDPLLKLAFIHYQFEGIHPFYDGNGRTGRIVNVLYLVLKKKLSLPVLCLSRYINQTRSEYYAFLSGLRNGERHFSDFEIYVLNGLSLTADFTMNFVKDYLAVKERTGSLIEEKLPKVYSPGLVDYLFYDFYTKNEYFRIGIGVSRNTASAYLKALVACGLLAEEKVGKEVLYKNVALFDLLQNW
jgi:Fic family protein